MGHRYTILVVMIWIFLTVAVSGAEEATVLARGDGFIVTTEDIDAQKSYFKERGFESNGKEHLNVAIKMRVFALEAKKLGLIAYDFEARGPSAKEMVDRYNKAANIYMEHVMANFPISDAAVETYYLAYPGKFLKKRDQQDKIEFVTPDDVYPLDEKLKKEIRDHLVQFRRPEIMENEFIRLKKAYHVSAAHK